MFDLCSDGKGLLVAEYYWEEQESGRNKILHTDPVAVEFEEVRVFQRFENRGGGPTTVLLRPDFRGIHPADPVPVWGDGSKNGWDTWVNENN